MSDNPNSAQSDYGSIEINGARFMLANTIDESIVNIQSRKVSQGDVGPDDHPMNSTWTQRDWTGGGQVKWGRPDTVNGRFDMSTSETMQANALSLPGLSTTWADPGASGNDVMALGEYNNLNWVSWGADIKYNPPAGDVLTDMGTNLTSAPVKKGVVWKPTSGALAGVAIFCIPLSSSFDYINVTTRTNVAKSAVDLCVWDNKLWRLGTNGELEYTTDLATWTGLTYIPDGSVPRRLSVSLTVGGEPTVYVTTDASVWVYDSISGNLLQSQLQYPRHPDQGKSAEVWRGDFYISVGDGVHRYNRSTIVAMGLDRDDGMPEDYRGIIVDMAASYNALFAIASGAELVSTSTDPDILFAGDDYMTMSVQPSTGVLMRWNGVGWHYVDSFTGYAPTSVFVSNAGNRHSVWYGANKKLYRMDLPRNYYNAKDNVTLPRATSSFHETSWYNYGWDGMPKILKNFEVLAEGTSSANYVDVFYKVENDENPWITLGRIDNPVEHAFYIGRDDSADPNSTNPNDYHGIGIERVKYRFELHRGSVTTDTPIIRWHTSVVRKLLRPIRTFRIVTLLSEKANNTPSEELRRVLIDAIKATEAANFTYQNEQMKVDIVALEFRSAGDRTKIQYVAKINLVESNETIVREDE